MKKTNQYISLLLAVLMTVGLSSCIKEDYAVSSDETATVNLMFTTRADLNQDGVDEDARIHEGIKTLRVILVQNGKVIVNHKAEGLDKGDAPVLSQTITFWQIPKAQSTFYAVANEESVEGLRNKLAAYTPESDFNPLDDQELRGEIITVQTGTIPGAADDIATNGLPIAGIYSEDLSDVEDGHILRIPITRAVAKMELTLTNNTGAPFRLDEVAMGSFFPNMTYLFPGKTLPEGVTYVAHTFETNATLDEGATKTFCFYFYESHAGENAYTIQLNDGSEYGATPILVEPEEEGEQATPLTSVERNTCVRVKGTIESKAWTLLANVLPWQHEEVSFDFDDTMSYTSEGWKKGTYRSKEVNNIRLFNDQRAAELNFTITAPSSLVRWTAELLEEGDGHYFEFEGPSSGEVFIGDATSAPTQTIKVRVINPDDEDYHEATLRVVATLLNGESYELDLTGEGGTAPGTAETINRYTLIQAR